MPRSAQVSFTPSQTGPRVFIPAFGLRRLLAAAGAAAGTRDRMTAAAAPLDGLLDPLADLSLLHGPDLDVLLGDIDLARVLGSALDAPASEVAVAAERTSTRDPFVPRTPDAAVERRRTLAGLPARSPRVSRPPPGAGELLARYAPVNAAGVPAGSAPRRGGARAGRAGAAAGRVSTTTPSAGDDAAARTALRIRSLPRPAALPTLTVGGPGGIDGQARPHWLEQAAAHDRVLLRTVANMAVSIAGAPAPVRPQSHADTQSSADLQPQRAVTSSSLLERVLVRASRGSAGQDGARDHSTERPGSRGSGSHAMAGGNPVSLRSNRAVSDVTAPDTGRAGGFRGLAQRTLHAGSSPTTAQPIPAETMLPREASFDRLDSALAESLSRILTREAKRHGIDLAGSVP